LIDATLLVKVLVPVDVATELEATRLSTVEFWEVALESEVEAVAEVKAALDPARLWLPDISRLWEMTADPVSDTTALWDMLAESPVEMAEDWFWDDIPRQRITARGSSSRGAISGCWLNPCPPRLPQGRSRRNQYRLNE
jgi:hypothetical protein